VVLCLSTVGAVSPTKGLEFPSYRGTAGRPALSEHFAERNGAFCMHALFRIYNPFTARTLPFMILAEAFGTHTIHKGQTSMPTVGFEHTISAGEGP